MSYKITYRLRGIADEFYVPSPNNILDAIFIFYMEFGITTEIVKIEQIPF